MARTFFRMVFRKFSETTKNKLIFSQYNIFYNYEYFFFSVSVLIFFQSSPKKSINYSLNELLSKCLNWVRCSLTGFDESITPQNNPKKLIFARVMFCGINFRKNSFWKLWANLLKKSAKGSRWIFTSNKNTVRHPPNAGQFFCTSDTATIW